MAVDCGAETTTKGHGRSDFAGQRRRSLDLLPQANVADGTPLKRQFQHQYDSGHRLITEWVATDTTAGTAFTLGTDFNAAPSSANMATVAYAMNLVGNRGSRTKAVSGTDPLGAAVAVSVGSYAYDNQDRATTVGALSPTWDARDNALNPGYGKTYGWDRRNRLVKVTAGTVTTLGYDAEGLRVSKQVGGGSVTNYLVDTFSPTGYPQVLVEYTGTGTGRQPQRTYTYGLDLISQRTVAGGLVEFFSNDALGTTRFLTRFDPGVTSLDGQLGELTTQTFTYDAYGLLASGSATATATAYLYTGEQWDNDVGAYYLRARWYLPEWGRFLSRDTIEGTPNDPLSLHKYLYCSDNPVNMVDPSGHEGDLTSSLSAASINSALTSMAIGAPFRAYKAAKQFEAGVALGDIAFDAATGIALDGAIGAALPGLFSIGSRIAPIVRITQVGGQVFGRAANSVWNLNAIARGRMIEQTILGRLPSTLAAGVKNFPVIDDLYQGVATSIKSIDLLAKTYQNTATLVNKIVAEAFKLAEFQGAALGKVTVTAGQIEERVLVVAVEEGAATTAQAEALVQAVRQAQAAYPGVKVFVKAVP